MKRRILCLFAAFVFAFGCGISYQSVQAQGFLLTELSSFGIPAMKVHRTDAVVCDGKISDNEYGNPVSFGDGSGLFLFMNGKYYNGKLGSSSLKQENFVVFGGDEIFCALRLRLDRSMLGEIVKDNQSCYRVSFSLGLTHGDHPALRGSLLTNTYYFSTSDQTCVGFTGERKARSVKEDSIASKPLSSYVTAYRENGCVTADGTKWTAAHYCKNVAFSLQENGSVATMTVEARIPFEDALLSVHPSQREAVRNSLKSNEGTLCGGLSTSVDLNAYSSLVTGLPSDHPAIFSSESETLRQWIKNNYETPVSGLFVPDVIPIPLYWCGEVPEITENSIIKEESGKPPVTERSPVTTTSVTSSVITSSEADVIPDGDDVSLAENSLENDESIFDSLPDGDELLPEDTEIVYDAKSMSSSSNEKENSLASSILATVTGAFLFATVMVLCMYFRESDKKADGNTKQSKGKKKKNTKDGKNH